MSFILTSRTRDRQPQVPVSVGRSRDAQLLTGAFVADETGRLFDASGKSRGTQTYTAVGPRTGLSGRAMYVGFSVANGLSMPSGCISMQSQVFSRIAVIHSFGNPAATISDTNPLDVAGAQWRLEETGAMLLIASNQLLVGSSPASTVPLNKDTVVGVTYDGTTTTFFCDGRVISGGSVSRTFSLSGLTIGSGNEFGIERFNGLFYGHLDWPLVLPVTTMQEYTRNPWQLFAPRRRPVFYSLAGGATDYPVTATDALTLADSATNVAAVSATATDALTLADTLNASAAGDYVATATDPLTLADATSNQAALSATGTDALSLVDSASNVAALGATATDALSLASTQSSSAAGDYVAILGEALDLVDVSSNTANLGATGTDSLNLADSFNATTTGDYFAAATEPLTLIDALTVIYGQAALAADIMTLAEAVSAITSGVYYATAIDALALTEAVSNQASLSASISEALALAELVTALNSGFTLGSPSMTVSVAARDWSVRWV